MKILGLDIGTTSIGWFIIEKIEDTYRIYNHEGKEFYGVIIFKEALNEKGKTETTDRREFRLSRRQYFHKKLRKFNVLRELEKFDFVPLTKEELYRWRKTNFKEYPSGQLFLDWLKTDEIINKNPYYFRAKFAERKYDWENNQQLKYELGRAFYHMAQRRGFKSNRLDQSDDIMIEKFKQNLIISLNDVTDFKLLKEWLNDAFEEYHFDNIKTKDLGDNEKKIKKIYNQIQKIIKSKESFKNIIERIEKKLNSKENLGKIKRQIFDLEEILNEKKQTLGQYFWQLYQKNEITKENIRGRYTDREKHYEKEFNKICETQKIPDDLKKKFYNAIFYQRPLKSQRGKVGYCLLEKNKLRAPISHPLYEYFVALQFVNNIKIKEKNNEIRFLNDNERKIALNILDNSKKINIEKLLKKIFTNKKVAWLKNNDTDADVYVNYKLEKKVKTNIVRYYLKKYLKNNFGKVSHTIKHKNNEVEVYFEDLAWHALFSFNDEKKLQAFAQNKLEMNKEDAEMFSHISIERGYGNLSLKAIKKIIPWLEKGLTYDKAVFMANIPYILEKNIWEKNKKEIENGLKKIFDDIKKENFIVYIVNSILDDYRENKITYSKQAENIFIKDVEKALISNIGKLTWERKTEIERKSLIQNTYEKLINHLIENKNNFIIPFLKRKNLEQKIIDFLIGKNKDGVVYCKNEHKLNNLYNPSKIEGFKTVYDKNTGKEILGLPFIKSINNPNFSKVMFNLRKLINHLILVGAVDKKTRINIEMAREINSFNKKKAIEQWQAKQGKLKEKAYKIIQEYQEEYHPNNDKIKHIISSIKQKKLSNDDIKKLILWKEQKYHCIYTGEQIGITDLIGNNPKFDLEHTIPRSRSWNNGMENLTVAERNFNRKIKGEKIPYELPEEKYEEILIRAKEIYEKKYLELNKQIDKMYIPKEESDRKNRALQKKYLLEFERDYYYNKFSFFKIKEIPDGFKKSQLNDTRLITKTAMEYLGSYFNDGNGRSYVYPVNAKSVSLFREIWMGDFEKSRDTHFHHIVDAAIVASIHKKTYQKLENIWKKEDDFEIAKNEIKDEIKNTKPWNTFTKDIIDLTNKTLTYHLHKEKVGKQTKKKLRKRGKIVKKNHQPIYLQGDTARGALHKQNFFGAIKIPKKDKNGKFIFDENNNIVTEEKIYFVKRENLEKIIESKAKIKDIVDDTIREIVIKDIEKNKEIKEELNKLNEKNKNATEEEEKKNNILIEQLKKEQSKLFHLPNMKNPNAPIPIKKIRVKSKLKETISVKLHNKVYRSKKDYKQDIYAENKNNFGLLLYSNKNKKTGQLINLFDFYQSVKNNENIIQDKITIKTKKGIELYDLLRYKNQPLLIKKGQKVILKKNENEEVQWNNLQWLFDRLYVVTGIDGDGIKMLHHFVSNNDLLKKMNAFINKRNFENLSNQFKKINLNIFEILNQYKQKEDLEIEKLYETIDDYKINLKTIFGDINKILDRFYEENNIEKTNFIKLKLSSLTTPKGGDEIYQQDNYKRFPYIKVQPNGFYGLLENIHFKQKITGEIEKLDLN